MTDKKSRDVIAVIDAFLRDASRAISTSQATTATGTGGVTDASYITTADEPLLSAERRLVVNSPLSGVDGGANSTYTLGLSASALVSLIAGTPANTYGTTFDAGVASTVVRTDARFKYPTALMSAANASTITLTDNAVDQTLTGTLGTLRIVPAVAARIDLPADASAQFIIEPDTVTAASILMIVQGRPVAGTRTLLQPNWFQPGSTDVFASQTFRSWDVNAAPSVGQHTGSTWVGYDISAMGISPSASSGAGNKAYGFRGNQLVIGGSTSATYDEVATALFVGPTRSIISPTVTVSAGIITEPAVVGGTKQVGLLVRQRTAAQTATDRLGIDIEEQNSGTNRWGLRSANRLDISSPAARAETVLLLKQLATGATAGAHINFDSKAGDPPAPATGDLWRNGDALWFRQAAASVDLAAVGSGGVTIRKNTGADVGTRPRLNLIEGSNITLTTTDDGVDNEVDITITAAAGGSGNFGTTTVDFGAFPGKSDASIGVTGQAAIVAGSKVNAWLRLEATADHSADEHMVESLRVLAGNIVAGTGFTIYARNDSELNEPLGWADPAHVHVASSTVGQNTAYAVGNPWRGGQGTRIYGQWTLQWQWA